MEILKAVRFSHREIIVAMLRASGITEGRWALAFNYQTRPWNIYSVEGPEGRPTDAVGVAVGITSFELQRYSGAGLSSEVEARIVVDAATLDAPPPAGGLAGMAVVGGAH